MKMEQLQSKRTIVKTEEITLLFDNILEVRSIIKSGDNVLSENVKHQKINNDNKVVDLTEQEFLNEKTLNLEIEIEEKQKELYKVKEKLESLNKKDNSN
jgi:hypothetical protein